MTALSLFVPLLAIAFAFWFLGDEAEYSWWRLPFAGVFVGLTSTSRVSQCRCELYSPNSRAHALLGCLPTPLPRRPVYSTSILPTQLIPDRYCSLCPHPRLCRCHRRSLHVLQVPSPMARLLVETWSVCHVPRNCRLWYALPRSRRDFILCQAWYQP
jgi:hypothetical protein